MLVPAAMAMLLQTSGVPPTMVVIVGLVLFAIVFAINSAVHSYLVLAYSDNDSVSLNVGFYYMANAGGRLAGSTVGCRVPGVRACRVPVVVGSVPACIMADCAEIA